MVTHDGYDGVTMGNSGTDPKRATEVCFAAGEDRPRIHQGRARPAPASGRLQLRTGTHATLIQST